MRKHFALLAATAVVGLASASVQAQSSFLRPGDFIIAVDPDAPGSNSSYPAAEGPGNVVDQVSSTKYLNFGEIGTGFIVTTGASTLQGLTLTTANDAPARDPASYEIFGTNSAVMSEDNSNGAGEPWTLISSGTLALPDERLTMSPLIGISNTTSYSAYKVIFPTIKDAPATNSMQVADVQFFTSESGSTGILASGLPTIAVGMTVPNSRYPAAEGPANLLDLQEDGQPNTATKYLNFGRDNAGFIVTPQVGPTVADRFVIITANDSPERDPSAYQIFGTNAVITEMDNGQGNADDWTLIAEGTITLPEERFTPGEAVIFDNNTEYTSYKVIFTDTRDDAANSVQLAHFALVPEPGAVGLIVLGAAGLLRRRQLH